MAEKGLFSFKQEGGKINFHVASSDKYIGYAYIEVDGYYVFVFENEGGGCWPGYALLEIGNKLKDLNKEWDEKINEEFSSKR
jgi:hypothetical protein